MALYGPPTLKTCVPPPKPRTQEGESVLKCELTCVVFLHPASKWEVQRLFTDEYEAYRMCCRAYQVIVFGNELGIKLIRGRVSSLRYLKDNRHTRYSHWLKHRLIPKLKRSCNLPGQPRASMPHVIASKDTPYFLLSKLSLRTAHCSQKTEKKKTI